MPNLQRTSQRPTPNRTLLQLNMPVESIPIKGASRKRPPARSPQPIALQTFMTIKTLADIARELANIASAQQQCAEQLADLANQLTTSTKPKAKPRSADRHLEPNRDRHSPGY